MNKLFSYFKERCKRVFIGLSLCLFGLILQAQNGTCVNNSDLTQISDITIDGIIWPGQESFPPTKIIDGDLETRWSVQQFPTVGVIDLKSSYPIGKSEVYPYKERPYLYTVEVSTDSVNFVTVVDRSQDSPGGSIIEDTFDAVQGRYVRFTITGCKDNCSSWASINELKLFCSDVNNLAPITNITKPTDNEVINLDDTYQIEVSTVAQEGSITSVSFFNGADSLGADDSSPYTFAWQPTSIGSKKIRVKAYDEAARTGIDSVEVFVTNFPEVSIQEKNKYQFLADYETEDLQIDVTATDTDGQVVFVDFFKNGEKFATDSVAPYSYTFENLSLGSQEIVVQAVDNDGAVSTDTLNAIVYSVLTDQETVVEAEHFTTINGLGAPEGMDYLEVLDASNDTVLVVNFKNTSSPGSVNDPGISSYSFTTVEEANFNFYVRVYAANGGSNSLFSRVDNGGWGNRKSVATGRFVWERVRTATLQPGQHTFYLARAESNLQLDRVVISPRNLSLSGKEGIIEAPGDVDFNPSLALVGVSSDTLQISKGEDVAITAIAEDYNFDIEYINFYVDDNLVTKVENDTAVFSLTSLDAGYHSVSVSTVDSKSNTDSTSFVVNVAVGPTVSIINPSAMSVIELGTSETIIATAEDDGEVIKVDFYFNGEIVSTDSTTAYTHIFEGEEVGDLKVVALATDNDGLTGSDTLNLSVEKNANFLSITSPAENDTFTEGENVEIVTDIADDGDVIARVDFYNQEEIIGNSTSKPFSYTIEAAEDGVYDIYAKGYSGFGTLIDQTDTVTFEVLKGANAIAITSPSNNEVFRVGDNITITSEVTNEDGAIAKVEFYEGENKLGEVTEKPYEYVWEDVQEGTYQLNVKTLNSESNILTESEHVKINVRPPLSVGKGTNPIAEYYSGPEGYPAWTNRIQWSNVIEMASYTDGANDFEKFENARDELYLQGGGVLYYSAGTYDFSDAPVDDPNGRGLMLKSGVVILGETPSGDAYGGDGTLELTTRFNFKFVNKGTEEDKKEIPAQWNIIGMMPDQEELRDINNIGIAWVHVEGATVYWGSQTEYGSTYATSGAWLSGKVKGAWKDRVPDGTYPMDAFCGQSQVNEGAYLGAGSGRFVFGCQFDNAIVSNDVYDRGFGEEGFSEFKYAGRISVYGSNVFVANNIISKGTKNFLYKQMTSEGEKDIMFDYGFATGIDINKNNTNVNKDRLNMNGGYFEEGVIVIDNWIYNHGYKTIDGAGNWGVYKNNYGARDLLTPGQEIYGLPSGWTLTADGFKTHLSTGSSDAFQNRGYDMAGKNLWIDDNYYENIGTPNPSNDGEGILCQLHGGTNIHSWAITNNTGVRGHEVGYLGGYDVHNYGVLIAWNDTPGEVGVLAVTQDEIIDAAFIPSGSQETVVVHPRSNDPSNFLTVDTLVSCPSGVLTAPTDVTVVPGTESITITWTDQTDQEIGYRVDRRFGGNQEWTPVVYRPRKSVGTEENEQKWIDYTAPVGVNVEYRVVAVNCDDDDSGASDPVGSLVPIKVESPLFSLESGTYDKVISVELTSATKDAEIYYTTDGSAPSTQSSLYEGSFELAETTTIKAFAVKGENIPSDITEATYVINLPQVASLSITPNGGEINSEDLISISTTTEGANVFYTIDGTDPDEQAISYTSPFTLNDDAMVKAIATKDGMTPSEILEVAFTIEVLLSAETGLAQELVIYPNPASSSLNIRLTNQQIDQSVEFYTQDGRLIKEVGKDDLVFYEEGLIKIDIQDLSKGIYYVKIVAEDQEEIKKLIIK